MNTLILIYCTKLNYMNKIITSVISCFSYAGCLWPFFQNNDATCNANVMQLLPSFLSKVPPRIPASRLMRSFAADLKKGQGWERQIMLPLKCENSSKLKLIFTVNHTAHFQENWT